jgi:hypothetical protein
LLNEGFRTGSNVSVKIYSEPAMPLLIRPVVIHDMSEISNPS